MGHYDTIILGAGTGNTLITEADEAARTAIVEPSRFAGTCLNRGCIPSKMFVLAADAAVGFEEAARLGVHGRLDRVDWPATPPLPRSASPWSSDDETDQLLGPAEPLLR